MPNWIELPVNPPNARKIQIHNLSAGTTYEFQVSTAQYSTVQYSTVQYSTVQYSAVQRSTERSTIPYSTAQYVINVAK